ncbi:MAG: hypothetical protein WKF84_11265 [Pyrinomonadaceae bacterium]
MTLAGLKKISGRFLTNREAEMTAGGQAMTDLRVKARSVATIAGTLSGGNQQKGSARQMAAHESTCAFSG